MHSCTTSGFSTHKSPPMDKSAVWNVKNFTARPEEETPAGMPRFFSANTCMGWPPMAAGVTLE